MPSKLLLVLVLALSLTALGQVSAPPRQDTATITAPTVAPPSSGSVVWTGVGPTGGVLLTTPEATFDSPQPTAGISLAGRTGISDAVPINTGVQSTMNNSTMVYVNMPATSVENVNPATEAVSSSNDLLPSYFSSSIGGAANPGGRSLAEIADMYKARQGTQTVRTYTNSDVPRENAGMLTNILLAENRLPAMPQKSATPSAPSSATQAQPSAGTETSAQAQPQNSDNRLPTSASILPLLGFLGLASSGLGLILRRNRR